MWPVKRVESCEPCETDGNRAFTAALHEGCHSLWEGARIVKWAVASRYPPLSKESLVSKRFPLRQILAIRTGEDNAFAEI